MRKNIESQEVRYNDLSRPLKTAIVMAWIIGILYVVLFLIGFFSTALE